MGASTRTSAWLAVLLLAVCTGLSALIPPFQSPDEFDHVKRAYLLTRGQVLLDAPEGQSSGGQVDAGLIAYMDVFEPLPFKPDRKLSAAEAAESRALRWRGDRVFSTAPGTGYYFPLIYAPQAIGLAVGRVLDLSVDASYRLSRLLALLAAAGVVALAFSIHAPPPLATGLLLIPMTLFQLSSATIDGLSAALAMLALSCFMRIANDRAQADRRHLVLLAIAVALVVSSRIHGLPLLALLGAACFHARSRRSWFVAAAVTAFVLAWLAVAAGTTVTLGAGPTEPRSRIAAHYLGKPLSFLKLVGATLESPVFARFYRDSFLGLLGWLDSGFAGRVYSRLQVLLGLLLVVSIVPADWRRTAGARALLAASAGASVLMVFFALLVTWNAHPATLIKGVQGRYFLLPAMMLAHAVGSGAASDRPKRARLGEVLLVVLLLFSSMETSSLLLDRYYLSG